MTVFFKSVNKQGGSVTGGPRVLTEQLGLDSDSTLCEIIRQAEKRGVDLTITFDQMEHRGNDAPDVNRG